MTDRIMYAVKAHASANPEIGPFWAVREVVVNGESDSTYFLRGDCRSSATGGLLNVPKHKNLVHADKAAAIEAAAERLRKEAAGLKAYAEAAAALADAMTSATPEEIEANTICIKEDA